MKPPGGIGVTKKTQAELLAMIDPPTGKLFYDTTDNEYMYWSGVAWITLTPGASGIQNVIMVSPSGGDYDTIQAAIDSTDGVTPTVIMIGPGTYNENLVLKNFNTLVGYGIGRSVNIVGTSGTVITLPNIFSEMSNLQIDLNPITTGHKVLDSTAGGFHLLHNCGLISTSSANGITANVITNGSDSILGLVDCGVFYTMTGSAAGASTHNVIINKDSATLRFARVDSGYVLGDIDDDINFLHDSGTGSVQNVTLTFRGAVVNPSYSGSASIIKHTATHPITIDTKGLISLTGAGSGTGIAIIVDTPGGTGIVTSAQNQFEVSSFGLNYFADVDTGDVLNSSADIITASDNIRGAGKVNFIGSQEHAELESGGGGFVINTQNAWHAASSPAPGASSAHMNVELGLSGSISAFADYSGTVAGTVKVTTTAAHGLSTGDYITQTGTTNYNDIFQVTVIDATNYYITATWVSDDATGFFNRGSRIIPGRRGVYSINLAFVSTAAGSNQDFVLAIVINDTVVKEYPVKYGTAGTPSPSSGAGQPSLEKDDHLWLAIKNTTSITDISGADGDFNIHKIG
jgi:hypothetical protein